MAGVPKQGHSPTPNRSQITHAASPKSDSTLIEIKKMADHPARITPNQYR